MTHGFSNSGSGGVTIDETVPHSARIWNYWLGGKDNYAVDREAGDAWMAVHPDVVVLARESRAFLGRAVEFLAGEAGIRQFLDIGTGLPTAENTHEIAQRVAPDARIVYVDNDPLILAHARALLTSSREGATRYLHADMHDAPGLVENASEILDFTEPVAVLFMGVLGHIEQTDEARSLVQQVMRHVPTGSYLAIYDGTHPADRTEKTAFEKAEDDYAESGAVPYRTRTPDEVASFFDGLELVAPGFVPVTLWRPAGEGEPQAVDNYGGVARKP
jgi:SAM-dependent methyltransferase